MYTTIFLYYILSLSVGIIALILTTFIYIYIKDKLLLYFLFLYCSFTCIIILNMFLLQFWFDTIPNNSLFYKIADFLEDFPVKYLFLFSLPLLWHYFYPVKNRVKKNLIIGIIILISYTFRHLSKQVLLEYTNVLLYISDIIFFFVIIYCIIIGINHQKDLQNSILKTLSKRMNIFLGFFILPSGINDIFLNFLYPIRFFPIIYAGSGILFLLYIGKSYVPVLRKNLSKSENFDFNKYGISEREKEIVILIIKGLSNAKISDQLYISLNTVKTHIRSIYQKFDIKNRFELITTIQSYT